MSFSARAYPDIVRDLLTALSSGTVRETAIAVYDDEGLVVPILLRKRPVRRISHVEEQRVNDDGTEEKIRYTPADYELFSSAGEELDSLSFRSVKKQPVAGSELTINYFPAVTDPVPLTDLNVGSVARTLMESFARELAATELQLEHVYNSAFLETAEGASLNKVVALIGMRRFTPGHAQANIVFNRNPETAGKITIATGTVVTDADGNRYKTTRELVLEAGESSREVLAAGATPATPEVDANALNRMETLVAGIGSVNNPKPAFNLSAREADAALRARAQGALHGVSFGTLNALKYGLLSITGINAVTVTEFPNDIPGEVLINIAFGDDSPAVRTAVDEAILKFRPAGVRVITAEAESVEIRVSVQLTLAGTGVNDNEIAGLRQEVETALSGYLEKLEPGSKARRAQLSALVLADTRIIDCVITLSVGELPPAEEFTLGSNQVVEVITPFEFPLIELELLPAPLSRNVVVAALVPYVPVAGVTEQGALSALQLAFDSFISTRSATSPVTVDDLASALRDETRYALVRESIVITVEVEDSFLQMTDGLGSFSPAAGDTLSKGDVYFDLIEGGI